MAISKSTRKPNRRFKSRSRKPKELPNTKKTEESIKANFEQLIEFMLNPKEKSTSWKIPWKINPNFLGLKLELAGGKLSLNSYSGRNCLLLAQGGLQGAAITATSTVEVLGMSREEGVGKTLYGLINTIYAENDRSILGQIQGSGSTLGDLDFSTMLRRVDQFNIVLRPYVSTVKGEKEDGESKTEYKPWRGYARTGKTLSSDEMFKIISQARRIFEELKKDENRKSFSEDLNSGLKNSIASVAKKFNIATEEESEQLDAIISKLFKAETSLSEFIPKPSKPIEEWQKYDWGRTFNTMLELVGDALKDDGINAKKCRVEFASNKAVLVKGESFYTINIPPASDFSKEKSEHPSAEFILSYLHELGHYIYDHTNPDDAKKYHGNKNERAREEMIVEFSANTVIPMFVDFFELKDGDKRRVSDVVGSAPEEIRNSFVYIAGHCKKSDMNGVIEEDVGATIVERSSKIIHVIQKAVLKSGASIIAGKSIVFTGEMGKGRAEMEEHATALGAKCPESITDKTDILVWGGDAIPEKATKAKEKYPDLQVMSEAEYVSKIGLKEEINDDD